MAITIKDIVSEYLHDNGHDGLWHEEGPCGCDGSAPCGDGPHLDCCAAHAGPGGEDANGDACDVLYHRDPRTIEDARRDRFKQARKFTFDEMDHWRMLEKRGQLEGGHNVR